MSLDEVDPSLLSLLLMVGGLILTMHVIGWRLSKTEDLLIFFSPYYGTGRERERDRGRDRKGVCMCVKRRGGG